jgi:hypothetical protein
MHPGLQDYHCFPIHHIEWRTYVALLISFWVAGSSIHGYSQSQRPESNSSRNLHASDCLFSAHIRALCEAGTPCDATRICWTVQAFQAFQRRSPSCSPSRGSCSHISMFMIHPQERSYSSGHCLSQPYASVEGSRTRRVQPKPPSKQSVSPADETFLTNACDRGNDAMSYRPGCEAGEHDSVCG